MTRAVWSCHSRVSDFADGYLYGDTLGHKYEYDSNVINHSQVSVGDILIIRDAHLIFGYSVVDAIEPRPGAKDIQRCPRCRKSGLAPRKSRLPRYRCGECTHEFDAPLIESMNVTVYEAVYESWWLEFPSPAPVRALDRVYAGRDRQNAIRRLDPVAADAMLRSLAGLEGHFHLDFLQQKETIPGGHVDVLVRQRIGQQRFRENLLERFGATCAVTGQQPDAVLDAAHLYAFAETPVHREGGGLLLRADVHRLFDRLLLTFDPVTWQSHVAPQLLERHEHLHALDSRPIAVPTLLRPSRDLIASHHQAARGRWRDIA